MDTDNTKRPQAGEEERGGWRSYAGGIFRATVSLLTGLKVTFREFFTRKVTEEYPDNRAALTVSARFRGTLHMPPGENGQNRCTACGLCEMNCPNGTLHLETDTVTDGETGKRRKVLREYRYDLGSCMFCGLCVSACAAGAIAFGTEFEHAVFNRDKLVKILNAPPSPDDG
ncbi:MAG: 4Fe-4S dicluster domain-containing protein [Tannerella sp.]|jgi:NADH-quinone oxidoreductase subunit I|nr:4Fe-4S dicluster domain-containing protein [Tannerella sp.]